MPPEASSFEHSPEFPDETEPPDGDVQNYSQLLEEELYYSKEERWFSLWETRLSSGRGLLMTTCLYVSLGGVLGYFTLGNLGIIVGSVAFVVITKILSRHYFLQSLGTLIVTLFVYFGTTLGYLLLGYVGIVIGPIVPGIIIFVVLSAL